MNYQEVIYATVGINGIDPDIWQGTDPAKTAGVCSGDGACRQKNIVSYSCCEQKLFIVPGLP